MWLYIDSMDPGVSVIRYPLTQHTILPTPNQNIWPITPNVLTNSLCLGPQNSLQPNNLLINSNLCNPSNLLLPLNSLSGSNLTQNLINNIQLSLSNRLVNANAFQMGADYSNLAYLQNMNNVLANNCNSHPNIHVFSQVPLNYNSFPKSNALVHHPNLVTSQRFAPYWILEVFDVMYIFKFLVDVITVNGSITMYILLFNYVI